MTRWVNFTSGPNAYSLCVIGSSDAASRSPHTPVGAAMLLAQNSRPEKEKPAGRSSRDGPKKTSDWNAQHKIVLDGPACNRPGFLQTRESRNGTPSKRAG